MSMLYVSQIAQPKRQIINNISISFFPDAKIGLNGSGKSTVLRIMARVHKEYEADKKKRLVKKARSKSG